MSGDRLAGAADTLSVSTEALVSELTRRQILPRCSCGKWGTYFGSYDQDGYTLRCRGCLRALGRCRC